MNLLAHAYLGFDHEERRVGQIAGDFIKGRDLSAYPEFIEEGIQLHRSLDAWTDRQRVFRQSCARFPKSRRRIAGILVDLLYDYTLARNWSSYCNIELAEFADSLYQALERHQEILPTKMSNFITRAPIVGVFEGYAEFSGMERAVKHIAGRMNDPSLFDGALDEMLAVIPGVDEDFAEFFPHAGKMAVELLPDHRSPVLHKPV